MELDEFLDNKIQASLSQLEHLRENAAYLEIERGLKARLEILKNELVTKRKIDKIRLTQGKCQEIEFMLESLGTLIEAKKQEKGDRND